MNIYQEENNGKGEDYDDTKEMEAAPENTRKEDDDDTEKDKKSSVSSLVGEKLLSGEKRMHDQITLLNKQAQIVRRKDRKRAAIARNSYVGARLPETNDATPKQGIEDSTNQGNVGLKSIVDTASRQTIENGVLSIDRQAAMKMAGITISSSTANTCMPDALETIISAIMNKNSELDSIQLPNGVLVTRSDMGNYIRKSLCPNQHDLPSLTQMTNFLEQIGLTVEPQIGKSKIEVLTQGEGTYLICCKFPDQPGSPYYCISYLVDSDFRLLVDNFPYQKPIKIGDSIIGALTNEVEGFSQRLSRNIHRKTANEIFKMVLGKHTNEIHLWYKISWTKQEAEPSKLNS